jgi:hypothetical protein
MVRRFIAFKADSSIATTEKTAVILLKRSPSDGSNLSSMMHAKAEYAKLL